MLKTGVAVFSRTPGSGGKTRLAATWGRDRTDLFYLHCLNCAAEWLQTGIGYVTPYWALTGTGSRVVTEWRGIPILEQVNGGLGERMADISLQLLQHHELWCLVGTDSPHMPPLSALKIPQRLQDSDFVFGPSSDGGFWLIAGRQPLAVDVFMQVMYSQSDTLKQLVQCIYREFPGCIIDSGLPVLTDVDMEEDLVALRRGLLSGNFALNTAQQQMLRWLLSVA